MFLLGGLDREERRRVAVIPVLLIAAAVFWAGFEQAGSSMNLFAERLTDRNVLGWELPATWLQSVNPCSSSCWPRCSVRCGSASGRATPRFP